jgi:hypothetical protein
MFTAGNIPQKLEIHRTLREMSHKNWKTTAECGNYKINL